LAALYQAEGQLSEAIFVYQQGISLASDYQDNYIQLANLYQVEGYLDKTKTLYQNAGRRNLNSAWPHLELGKFYLTQVN
jgi:tetratricopeptide (TPR) repeat protein